MMETILVLNAMTEILFTTFLSLTKYLHIKVVHFFQNYLGKFELKKNLISKKSLFIVLSFVLTWAEYGIYITSLI